MNVCVIGGGLSGLSAAYYLAKDATVELYERDMRLGGCCASLPVGDAWIEKFYHHCFAGDRHLLDLIDDLGLTQRLEWRTGTTGYFVDGTIYPLSTPMEILRYPHLTLGDKARLALLTLRSARYDVASLDDVPAKEFVESTCGSHVYTSFFEPLLTAKFGEKRTEVSAAWLLSRIAIRSNRSAGGERLGYLDGGYQTLIEALERQCTAEGCTLHTGSPVRELKKENGAWTADGKKYDAVVSTIAPGDLARIGGPQLPDIPYQGAACMTLGLDREVTNGIYWLNMKDRAPYGAVIGHTNFVPKDRYGEHIVYLASYFTGDLPPNYGESMLGDFCSRFGVEEREIHWHTLTVEPSAGPIYTTGYRRHIPSYREEGLFLAGMFSRPNYPERSMEGSLIAGKEVADQIRGGVIA
jgi:protoporphyrinogen oxidase